MDKQKIFDLINENKMSILEIAMLTEVQYAAENKEEMMNLPSDKFDEIVKRVAKSVVYEDYIWEDISDFINSELNREVGEN